MPSATTSLAAARTTKGRCASLATSNKASPRSTLTVRWCPSRSTRTWVSVFKLSRLPSASTRLCSSPTPVRYSTPLRQGCQVQASAATSPTPATPSSSCIAPDTRERDPAPCPAAANAPATVTLGTSIQVSVQRSKAWRWAAERACQARQSRSIARERLGPCSRATHTAASAAISRVTTGGDCPAPSWSLPAGAMVTSLPSSASRASWRARCAFPRH